MNKLLTVMVVILLIFVGTNVFAVNTLFNDGFETGTVGNFPTVPTGDGASWSGPSGTATVYTTQISNAQSYYGANSFFIQDSDWPNYIRATANFNQSTDDYIFIDYYVRPSAIAWAQGGSIVYADSAGKKAAEIQFSDIASNAGFPPDNHIFYYTGGVETDTGFVYAANTWYHIRVVANQVAKTYSIFINDMTTAVVANTAYRDGTAGYITKIYFESYSFLSGYYFDDVKVFENDQPPAGGGGDSTPPNNATINSGSPLLSKLNPTLDVDFTDDTNLYEVQYKIDSNTLPFTDVIATNIAGATYTADWQLTAGDWTALSDGSHTIYFLSIDDALNMTISSTNMVVTKDTTAPSVDAGTDVDWTKVETWLSPIVSDANGIASYLWSIDAGVGTPTWNPNNTVINPGLKFGNGDEDTFTLRLTATDNAGNSAFDTLTFKWDKIKPTVVLPADVPWRNTPLIIDATITVAGAPIVLYLWTNNQITAETLVIDDSGIEDATLSGLDDEAYVFDVKLEATDQAGNKDNDRINFSWDAIDPVVDVGTNIATTSVPYAEDATASDVDSGIATYLWTQESGPGTLTFGTPAAEDTTINTATEGFYVIRLTVTDNVGNTSFDETQFAYYSGPPTPIVTGTVVTTDTTPTYNWNDLSGFGVTKYRYSFTDGVGWTETVLLTHTPGAARPEGDNTLYVQSYSIAQGWSVSGSFTTAIDLTAPSVDVGADIDWTKANTWLLPTTSDANGIASYAWTIEAGVGTATFSDASAEDTTLKFDNVEDIFTVRLTVTDNVGWTAFDELLFKWDKIKPVVTLPADISWVSGPTLIDALVSTTGAPVVLYFWKDNGVTAETLVIDDNSIEDATVYGLDGESKVFDIKLEATDQAGNKSNDRINLSWDGIDPAIEAGPDIAWTNVIDNLDSANADFESGLNTFLWEKIAGTGTVIFGNTAIEDTTIIGTAGEEAAFTIRLTTTDIAGNSISDTLTFNWDDKAPVVNAGTDAASNTVYLQNATVTDAGGIATYLWTMQAGPGVIIFGSGGAEDTTISATLPGIYTIRLTAIDNFGKSDFDEFTLNWDATDPTDATVNTASPLTTSVNPTLDIDFADDTDLFEVQYKIDDNTFPFSDVIATSIVGATYTTDWQLTAGDWAALTPGNHTVYFRSIDAAGNTNISTTNMIINKVGALDHIDITDAADGTVITTHTMTADDTYDLYASGYDSANNYLGLISVDWDKTGTLDSVTQTATNITFSPVTAPTAGTITVDDGATHTDATSTITVNVGALASVKITDAADGTEITTHTMTADDTYDLYASGYDADNNYRGLVSLNWDKTGTLDAVAQNATNITFSPTTAPTSGTITVDGLGDVTGAITVNLGALSYILITDAADGTEITTNTMTTDDTYNLFASGYDADNNYRGLVSVDWAQTGTIESVVQTATNITFSPTIPSSGTITADDGATHTDTTGAITVNVGALSYILITDAADGTETTTNLMTTDDTYNLFASGYDAEDNYIGLISVDWDKTGTLDAVAQTATNITFSPATGPTSGTITVDDLATHTDATGVITVNIGALNYILITDAADGTEITTYAMTTDDTYNLFASGYDAEDNYIGLINSSWASTGTLDNATQTATNITFSPSTAPTSGTITVDDLATHTDATGVITVTLGTLSYIKITDAADGAEITTHAMTIADTYTLYASGYDAGNNYTGLVSVTWGVTGTLDATPSPGTSTTFSPSTAPTSGTITADDGATHTDVTGAITVALGPLSYIKITDAADGAEITTYTMTADDTYNLFASGYDVDNNYRGLVPVTWAVTGTLDATPSPGTSTTFSPTIAPTTGTITADDGATHTDATGVITVNTGALNYIKITDAADGTEIATNIMTTDDTYILFASGYDAEDNYRGLVSVTWGVTGTLDVTPSPGTSTTFNPATAATAGTITADDGATHTDVTGAITVNVGALSYIKVTETANGVESTTHSMIISETYTLYASGYDADNNYIGLIISTWTTGGTLDATPSPGTSTVFAPSTISSGAITADDGAGHIDATGIVTVGVGPLDHILITDAADGVEITTNIMTTDDTYNLFASSYDAANNYLGLIAVNWDKTGTLESVATNATNITFSPTIPSSGTITVDDGATHTDATGTITVGVGALNYIKVTDTANGVETTTNIMIVNGTYIVFASGYDAENNYISLISVTWATTGTLEPTSTPGTTTTFNPTNAGTGTITADAGGGITDATGLITVGLGTLDHFTFVTQPADTISGTPMTIKIEARDMIDNLVAAFSGTATLSDTTGTITPTSIDFTNGVFTGKVTVAEVGSNIIITISYQTISNDSDAFDSTSAPHSIRNNMINPNKGDKVEIYFDVSGRTKVTAIVYNTAGQPVKKIIDKKYSTGSYSFTWDGKNKRRKIVIPGIYHVIVRIGKDRQAFKVLVVR